MLFISINRFQLVALIKKKQTSAHPNVCSSAVNQNQEGRGHLSSFSTSATFSLWSYLVKRNKTQICKKSIYCRGSACILKRQQKLPDATNCCDFLKRTVNIRAFLYISRITPSFQHPHNAPEMTVGQCEVATQQGSALQNRPSHLSQGGLPQVEHEIKRKEEKERKINTSYRAPSL